MYIGPEQKNIPDLPPPPPTRKEKYIFLPEENYEMFILIT
jgi:hypothetical protein